MLDSSFWIALADESDQWHSDAIATLDVIEDRLWLIPWPTLYEFINTRLMRQKEKAFGIRRKLSGPRVHYVDDAPYRTRCLEEYMDARIFQQPLSLVDSVMRAMLSDPQFRISCLVTFNLRDFEDVCAQTGVILLPD